MSGWMWSAVIMCIAFLVAAIDSIIGSTSQMTAWFAFTGAYFAWLNADARS